MSSPLRRRRLWTVALSVAAVAATAAATVAAPPGDPTDGHDPLVDALAPLADLNLRPDFELSAAQKQRIQAIRDDFGRQMDDWRTSHGPAFAGLHARGVFTRTFGHPTEDQWRSLQRARQELLASSPDPDDAVEQVKAVLSDDQRRRLQARLDAVNGPAQPTAVTYLPVPPDGVCRASGFYRFKVNASVPTEAGTRHVRMTYVMYLPVGYDPGGGPYPTLVFLHGAGEVGTDGNGCLVYGPAAQVRRREASRFARTFPFIVVCPQCPPRGERWDQTPVLRAALAALDDAGTKVRVDPDRVYVTGLSMGGKGTWLLAGLDPGRFAAIAPISASTLDLDVARRLTHTAVWAIDGADDIEDGAAHNRAMVEANRAAGGDARLTLLPNEGHYVWDRYYTDPKFYDWFLTHRRPAPADRQAAKVAAATRPTTAP